LKWRSDKLSARMKVYVALMLRFLREHPRCELCPRKSKDVHHKMGRGKWLLVTSTWMAVCRKCHDKIEANKKWAREMGYILYH
jgi:hypothetical protein